MRLNRVKFLFDQYLYLRYWGSLYNARKRWYGTSCAQVSFARRGPPKRSSRHPPGNTNEGFSRIYISDPLNGIPNAFAVRVRAGIRDGWDLLAAPSMVYKVLLYREWRSYKTDWAAWMYYIRNVWIKWFFWQGDVDQSSSEQCALQLTIRDINIYYQVRNVSLPGAEPLTSIDSLTSRFLDAGFQDARALTLKEIRRSYIEPEELVRWVLFRICIYSHLKVLQDIETRVPRRNRGTWLGFSPLCD